MARLVLSLILCLCLELCSAEEPIPVPCPFTDRCQCKKYRDTPADSPIFASVYCLTRGGEDRSIPTFKRDETVKYNVTGTLALINFDLRSIPANHFAAFGSIDKLYLEHEWSIQPRGQQWHPEAFNQVQIRYLEVLWAEGVVPVPAGLKNLEKLELYMSGSYEMPLLADSFKGMPNLRELILDTKVGEFHVDAFRGIEDQLTFIHLGNFFSDQNLAQAAPALKKFTKLREISVGGKELKNVDLAAFSEMTIDNLRITLTPLFARSITTTNSKKFPTNAVIRFPSGHGFQFKPVLADLLTNNPTVRMNLSSTFPNQYNTFGLCGYFDWFADFECPKRIQINLAYCVTPMYTPLDQYLREVDPNTKCHRGN